LLFHPNKLQNFSTDLEMLCSSMLSSKMSYKLLLFDWFVEGLALAATFQWSWLCETERRNDFDEIPSKLGCFELNSLVNVSSAGVWTE
jgi:hypothetical protein